MAALGTLLDKVIKPLLAGASKPRSQEKANLSDSINCHYEAIRREMHGLFDDLGIAA